MATYDVSTELFDCYTKIDFPANSENESFARVCAAAFITRLNPTLSDISDVKTSVSEAVTNAIIHGYGDRCGIVSLFVGIKERIVTIIVSDEGVGIEDIGKAREPLFTSRPELERSGMGFTVMECFCDSIDVTSERGRGTKVTLTKALA